MSAALPVVGEKGGGGGGLPVAESGRRGLRKPARRRAQDGSEMALGCGSGRGITGLSGRGLTDGGDAGVWRLIRGTATERRRRGIGSCWRRRRIAMVERLTDVRRRWRGEELRQRGFELSHCDRTTLEMRGLSSKIILGDSQRSENAQTHT
jgi:hypothetical protein